MWISERDSKLRVLDSKRQSISRLSEEIRGINPEEPDNRQLRILDRSIKYYQEYFKQINEPIPDLYTGDRRLLKSELERTGLALQKIISYLDQQENALINKAQEKERILRNELSSTEREIVDYNNKIQGAKEHIETLNKEIMEAENNISELDSLFKTNSTDIIQNTKAMLMK